MIHLHLSSGSMQCAYIFMIILLHFLLLVFPSTTTTTTTATTTTTTLLPATTTTTTTTTTTPTTIGACSRSMGLICSCSLISTLEYCTPPHRKSFCERRVNVHGCMQDVFRKVFLFSSLSYLLTVVYDVTSVLAPETARRFHSYNKSSTD